LLACLSSLAQSAVIENTWLSPLSMGLFRWSHSTSRIREGRRGGGRAGRSRQM